MSHLLNKILHHHHHDKNATDGQGNLATAEHAPLATAHAPLSSSGSAPLAAAPLATAPLSSSGSAPLAAAPLAAAPMSAPLAKAPMSAPLAKGPLLQTTSSSTVVDEGIVERETIVKEAIIDEKVRVDTLVEVQPILHRDIDQNIVHHVEQHVVEPAAAFVGGTVTNQPIIQETVVTKVVDEIQPIVHRELAVPVVKKVEEHLAERIVEPTVHTHDVKHGSTFDQGAIIKPAIVDETTRVDTVTEIQPIIHRTVERVVVNHIEQHINEAPAAFVGGTVRKEQLVEEKVRTNEVEEITPIVHREVAVAKLEKVEEHLQEQATAPTQHTHAVASVAGLASGVVHDKNAIVKPAIVDEKIRQDTLVQIQPIVHREIEKPVVHHVEQHIQEAPAPFIGGTYTNQPIIDEHRKTKVVDEIQPVVHKEKAVLQVEQREEHFAQHIVAPTQHTNATANLQGHVSDIKLGQNTVLKPAVVQETVRQDTFVEVQPIVHKQVTQPVVHHIEEHIQEPAAANVGGTIRNQAIIDQHINTPVVEEIQPIVHREISVPKLERVEEHSTQNVVLPTTHTKTVAAPIAGPAPASLVQPHHSGLQGLKEKVEVKLEERKLERDEKKAGQAL